MRISTLAIVGVGLIGGSIALAARRRGIVDRVVGVVRRPEARAQALDDGLLDEGHAELAAAVAEAELIVFCTPVDCIPSQVVEAASHCRPGTLMTDAGSTKATIVREVRGQLPAQVEFVGSHPLAGSEKHGLAHANADLFVGRVVVVTPAAETSDNALSQIREFWTALGARVRVMDAEEHDRALALTSHLPHLVASALAGILPAEWYDLTAGGFRDTTRIASGLPDLWSAILRTNPANVLTALDRLETQLRRFRAALLQDDRQTLETLLRQGKEVRDRLAPPGERRT